jgi:hypothetical protein
VIGDADLERAQRRYRIALQNAPAQLLTECRA